MPFYNQRTDLTNVDLPIIGDPSSSYGIFAKGYTMAANRLAELLLHAPRFSVYEAYPVIFLYRHALELYLKHFIHQAIKIIVMRESDGIAEKLPLNHNLKSLAELSDKFLIHLFPTDDELRDFSKSLLKTAIEFQELTPKAETYRYPVDKNKQPLSAPVINLQSVHNHMTMLLSFCDIVTFGINIEIDEATDQYELIEAARHFLHEQ